MISIEPIDLLEFSVSYIQIIPIDILILVLCSSLIINVVPSIAISADAGSFKYR